MRLLHHGWSDGHDRRNAFLHPHNHHSVGFVYDGHFLFAAGENLTGKLIFLARLMGADGFRIPKGCDLTLDKILGDIGGEDSAFDRSQSFRDRMAFGVKSDAVD